jgi:hypothetical protein
MALILIRLLILISKGIFFLLLILSLIRALTRLSKTRQGNHSTGTVGKTSQGATGQATHAKRKAGKKLTVPVGKNCKNRQGKDRLQKVQKPHTHTHGEPGLFDGDCR